MTSPISSIGALSPISSVGSVSPAGGVGGADAVGGAAGAGSDFTTALGKGLDAVDTSQQTADNLALQAATGQSVDPAAVTVAMTQAQLMTQLVATVQSKAVTAFNTIMGMQA